MGSLPAFFQNKRLAWMAVLVTLMSIMGLVFSLMVSWIAALIWVALVLFALVFVFDTLQLIGKDTEHYIAGLSYRINRGEQEAIAHMPIGVLLFNENYEIDWVNPYLQSFLGDERVVTETLADADDLLANIIINWHPDKTEPSHLEWLGRIFEVKVQPELRAVYLLDVSDAMAIEQAYEEGKLFFGVVSLDNYDEVTERMNDADIADIRSYVTRTISSWMEERGIYVRRLTADRYMLIGYREGLKRAEADKFNVMNTIRETTSIQNTPITLSIGIAYHEDNIMDMATAAQTQLDLALGRGGDQVVVKAPDQDARFYGGNTNPMAKRTRVRARVISQALIELINQADQVFVMGHTRADMDSIGAGLGVRRLAQMVNKPAWVVVNSDTTKMHADMLLLHEELAKDTGAEEAWILPDEALAKVTENSLLVLVDHSKPTLTESLPVLDAMRDRLVIIDHHRRGEEFPERTLLTYIESYASSTSELVTELFEYQPRRSQGLTRIEATTLLAGIQLDTKSFTLRSGTRTFDAASYLRSVGADGQLIQAFMKESLADYRDRAHLIERSIMTDDIAIVIGEDDIEYDAVVAAQVADSLLQVIGVQRSFVVARRDAQTVAISARSTGAKSVQLIMEQMGGGGHLSNAATQLTDITTKEAGQQLIALLDAAQAEETTE
jgi:c-di-AMP phosphodiesterase-like protein